MYIDIEIRAKIQEKQALSVLYYIIMPVIPLFFISIYLEETIHL